MLSKPTTAQLRSAVILAGLPAWREVEGWIDSELAAVVALMLDSRDPTTLHQMQGRAKALKELKQAVGNASLMLEKVERPSGGTRGY